MIFIRIQYYANIQTVIFFNVDYRFESNKSKLNISIYSQFQKVPGRKHKRYFSNISFG